MYYLQGCSPKILTRGALYKRSWHYLKKLNFSVLKTLFSASHGFLSYEDSVQSLQGLLVKIPFWI